MALSVIADENVEVEVVAALRASGHAVTHIADTAPGASDAAVLDMAAGQARVLITNDKDFGELVFRRHRVSSGVVLVRLPGRAPSDKARLVVEGVRRYSEGLLGAFLVIGTRAMRLRRTPE